MAQRWAAFFAARLQYQYLFGAAVWLLWLGSLARDGVAPSAEGIPVGIDFLAFHTAGALVLEGRTAELYDFTALSRFQLERHGIDGVMHFLNPPFFALFMAPFALLPFLPSLALWTAFSLGWLAAGLRWLEGTFRWRTFAAALCFFPVFVAVKNGQNTLLTLGLFCLVYRLQATRRDFAAGLAAGLLLYKPHLLAGLGLWWLVQARRRWPSLLGLAVGGGLLLAATALLLPEPLAAYVSLSRTELANWIHQPGYCVQMQYTIRGFVLTLLPGQRLVAEVAQAMALVGGAAALALFCRRRPELPLCFGAATVVGLLISPYLVLYDWALLLIPAVLWLRHAPALADFWPAPFALVWLMGYVGRALVELQLAALPAAAHLPYLTLLACAAAALLALYRLPAEGGR